MTYLDANATEPTHPAAIAAALAAMETVGNPSSIHAAGRAARRLLEGARETLAARFGAAPGDVVFTSGGTEANALAVRGLAAGRRVIIGATEHDAVGAAVPGAVVLPADAQGLPDLDRLATLLREAPALVCLMLANNETGTILPIAEAAALCRAAGALLHVDAVQAAGRIPVDLVALGGHSLAISGHKLGGIPGGGALLLAPGVDPTAQLAGGGQERGRRGGTHALPAIAAMAAAAGAIDLGRAAALAPLRDAIERHATEAGAIPLAATAPRLPNTASLALPGMPAATQVIALDLAGVQVSAGAACSSGKVAASHVLAAMGLGALAGQAIRVSLPWNATAADVTAFAAAYTAMVARFRQGRAA